MSITVLGKTFSSEAERREYFREELRKKLPELKKIEGFPIGEDEDIIALSDPPYYTACPNPWLNDFIAEWEREKQELERQGVRNPEFEVEGPYASDVSAGKNNPIYNAHSYHTKVPHPAIMRYILYYTQPGDIVFDGFAGTGMTGFAALLCQNPNEKEKYLIEKDLAQNSSKIVEWGGRKAILSDLSPAATFISNNFSSNISPLDHHKKTNQILADIKKECGWMYETRHTNEEIGNINFTIWSEVFLCDACESELVYWKVAIDHKIDKVKKEFLCTGCGKVLTKNKMKKVLESYFDPILNQSIQRPKSVPVLINYDYRGKRYLKQPDDWDINLISQIERKEFEKKFPVVPMVGKGKNWGDTWRAGVHAGITHLHHFYTKRNLITLAHSFSIYPYSHKFLITALIRTLSKMFRWAPKGKHTAGTSGTLYLPSISHEYPILRPFNEERNLFLLYLITVHHFITATA